MIEILMLSTILASSPPIPQPASAEQPGLRPNAAKETAGRLSLDEVRSAYLKGLQGSAKRKKPVYSEVVPVLADVYGQLKDVEGLSHAERSRMREIVKTRMEDLRGQLIRELLRDKQLADRNKRRADRSARGPVDERAALLAGGGASAQAVKLIDLIQNAIEPESWQANGGKGTISYFDLLKVLVVRQTGEVHHQLGGALEQLGN